MQQHENDMSIVIDNEAYYLDSVARVSPIPSWLTDDNWFRYVIIRKDNELVGYHIGTKDSVTDYAMGVAESLNERRMGFQKKPKSITLGKAKR